MLKFADLHFHSNASDEKLKHSHVVSLAWRIMGVKS